MDLYNAEIVAWGISDHPDAALCVETAGKLSERYGSGLEGLCFTATAALPIHLSPTGNA